MSVTIAGIYLGAAVVARHRAQATADLAALAAAGSLPEGYEQACRKARSIATAMAATVTACDVDELDVVVTVEVAVGFGGVAVGPAKAGARAGPATG